MILPCAVVFFLFEFVYGGNLNVVYSWKELDFNFPNQDVRQRAIATGEFIVQNNLPLGLEVWRNKLFITVPRWKKGVASSLNYINLTDPNPSPRLNPYPDWSSHNLSSFPADSFNRRIRVISPFRVRADECDRLWVLDSGIESILDSTKVHRPTSLMVFDLPTDRLIRFYQFPATQLKPESFFANLVVDVTGEKDCANTFVYTGDLGGSTMVVYDWKKDKSWRIEHQYFHADPLGGDFNIHDLNFQWTDGLFGMSLSKVDSSGYRDLYFHSFSSFSEFKVSTRILRDPNLAASSYHAFKYLGTRGFRGQASVSVLHQKSGIMFYTQVIKDAIGCWNIAKEPYNEKTQGIADLDNTTLSFSNDLTIDKEDNLWVLSDKMHQFLYAKLDKDSVNFRVLKGPVMEITKNTVCDSDYKDNLAPSKSNSAGVIWAMLLIVMTWKLYV